MDTYKLLQHIERMDLDNRMYNTFTVSVIDTESEFIKRYFGGQRIMGHLDKGQCYVTFWVEDARPAEGADVIVTDNCARRIYIYRAE